MGMLCLKAGCKSWRLVSSVKVMHSGELSPQGQVRKGLPIATQQSRDYVCIVHMPQDFALHRLMDELGMDTI